MLNQRFEIAASLIPVCVQVGVELGVDAACLQRYIDRIELDDLETETVDYRLVLELVDLIAARSGRDDIEFLLGEAFSFHFSPSVSTYLNSVASLRALVKDLDMVRLFFSRHFTVHITELRDAMQLEIHFSDDAGVAPDPRVRRLASAGILMFCQKLLEKLLGQEGVIGLFCLSYPAPDNQAAYERHLKAPVRFGCPVTGFRISPRLLDIPLRGGMPSLNSKARQRMQILLGNKEKASSLVGQIGIAFQKDNRLLSQPLEATAEFFNISERTLQRRLQHEGITFFELQEEAKKQMAEAWLREGLSAETVSDRLGFSDRRSFCRAFKRWTGCTPSRFRTQGEDAS